MFKEKEKPVLPAAIESMIEGLVDPQRNTFLKESHLAMIERSIQALQEAVLQYKSTQKGKR